MTYLDPLLDRLVAFEPTTLPVLSLYLNTSSDQHGRDDYASFLRKEMKAGGKTFPLRSPERASFERDAERITTYLTDALRPSSNAVALFACAGADGFFEHVQLDAPMEGHRLYVADPALLADVAASGRCCGIDCEMSLDLNAVSRIPAMNQQRTESTPT